MANVVYAGDTTAIAYEAGVLLIAHGMKAPSREDWQEVCKAVARYHAQARAMLVVTQGAAPDAEQRRAVISELPKGYQPPPMAVVTESTLVIGAITAMNWFLRNQQRAFRPGDLDGIAKHLQLSPELTRSLVTFTESMIPRR